MNLTWNKLADLLNPALWLGRLHTCCLRAAQRRTPRLHLNDFQNIHPAVTFETGRSGKITIGSGVTICQGAIISTYYGGHIVIEDHVYIGPYCVIYGHGGLHIGRNSLIAAHSVIIPANHRFERLDRPIVEQGVTARGIQIDEDCWLGASVQVLDGVHIGAGAVVAAGAVVTRSIPGRTVCAGVPARVLRERTHSTDSESELHLPSAMPGFRCASEAELPVQSGAETQVQPIQVQPIP